MKQCKCEHWQECPTCMPHRFDTEGNRLPPEPTPLQAAKAEIESLKQRLFEMQNAAIDLAKHSGNRAEEKMSREEVIRMARGAGLYHFHDSEGHCSGITDAVLINADKDQDDERLVQMLMPFAALVAAAEREAIAKSLDKQADLACDEIDRKWAKEMAAAVRARGDNE